MKKVLMVFLIAMFIVAFAYSQSITVTNPHSGQTWYKGNTYTITWTKSGSMNANVKIRLYQGGVKILSITNSTPNNGSYSWPVPNSLPSGTYKIRVKTIDNAVYDDSEVFEIANPLPSGGSISITHPAAGECWEKGSTHTITWTKSGSMNANVKIRLFQSSTKVLNITNSTPNNGSYPWTVPTTLSDGTYYIRVKTIDNAVFDNGGYFYIKSSCDEGSGPSFDLGRFTAALDPVELAILMHGPGPISIGGIGSMKEVLEKQGVKIPIRVTLMRGREVVQDFGVFKPVLKRGRVFFNSMPATFSLKLTPKMKEIIGTHPEEFRLVIMSKGEVLAEKPLKLQERRRTIDSRLTTINPKIIKNIRVVGCPDPAVVDIKFSIVQRYSQFRGKVRITGVVKNVGKADYISKPGRQSIVLDAGDAAHPLKTIPFTNLKSGQSITISYELNWDSASPNEGEFPPTYRVYIVYDPDITMDSIKTNDDCNVNNNSMTKSGKAINDMLK